MTDDSRATFTLRASRAFLDLLKNEADLHSHSMNAEIIQRLEQSLQIGGLVSTIKSDDLNPEESALVSLWRGLDREHREAVISVVSGLVRSKKYI
ncbi:Arc family DNA-binding protein [Komagataeibacter rhaeticus]|uniref:Arc family DNA-binding protein n=1 Tax=Acetobacteraceae TaxID=433 RepID=UPI0028E02046|nr:Arc family DNA-binding protein [Komagataeibacter rhaeticus]